MVLEYPWDAGGTLTRVLEAGDTGVPLVLLHGVGARADRFRGNLEVLAEAGLHAFAVDFPGHGFAAKGSSFADYSVPGFASFVERLMDSLGIGDAVLIGTSLGGNVAAKLACESPDRVLAVVLVGTLGLLPLGAQTRDQIATSLTRADEDAIRAKLTRVLHDPSLITDEWVATESRINNSPSAQASFAALAEYIRADVDDDVVGSSLAALASPPPAVLIWGAEDRIVPSTLGTDAKSQLGLQMDLHLIDATGHAPYYEAPEQFNELTISFLRSAGVIPPAANAETRPQES